MKKADEEKNCIKEALNRLYGKKKCIYDVASYYPPYYNDRYSLYHSLYGMFPNKNLIERDEKYIDFNSRVLKNTLVDLKCNFKIACSINSFIITYRHSGLCFAEEFHIDFMANPDLFKKELNEIIYRFKIHVMNSFNREVIVMQSEIYKDLGIKE